MPSFKTTVELDEEEFEVEVEYDYTPGSPDVMYLPNGDPGYPGDEEEAEITAVTTWRGKEVLELLSDGQVQDLEEMAIEFAREEGS